MSYDGFSIKRRLCGPFDDSLAEVNETDVCTTDVIIYCEHSCIFSIRRVCTFSFPRNEKNRGNVNIKIGKNKREEKMEYVVLLKAQKTVSKVCMA